MRTIFLALPVPLRRISLAESPDRESVHTKKVLEVLWPSIESEGLRGLEVLGLGRSGVKALRELEGEGNGKGVGEEGSGV